MEKITLSIKIITKKLQKIIITLNSFYLQYKLYIWISLFIIGTIALGFTFYYFFIYFKKSLILASVANSVNVEETKALVKAVKLSNKDNITFFHTYMPSTDLRKWFHLNYDPEITGRITNSPKMLYDNLNRIYYILDQGVVNQYYRDNILLPSAIANQNMIDGLIAMDPENYNASYHNIRDAMETIERVNKSIIQINKELIEQKIARENAFVFSTLVIFCLGVTIYAGYKIIVN